MALIQIVHRVNSHVLFQLDKNPNTLRDTLEAGIDAQAPLQGADLWGADLQKADLQKANLRGANLQKADLWEATLQKADLRGANLQGANLQKADLWEATLQGADLQGADLGRADLRGADLWGADLRGADLWGADLRGADLGRANLRGETSTGLAIAQTSIVPESGAFDAWKKCRGNILAHIRIPADAQRSNATGRKCRASHVEVLALSGPDGEPVPMAQSLYDDTVEYRIGAVVSCDAWDSHRWNECSGGIHFYLTRIEALNHS